GSAVVWSDDSADLKTFAFFCWGSLVVARGSGACAVTAQVAVCRDGMWEATSASCRLRFRSCPSF
ncbi:unnamed protein product, partial [Brassica rapa subsp. narinosa]